VHDRHGQIRIGKALRLTEGNRVLIVSTGITTRIAMEAAKTINSADKGTVEVLEIHTFKPFDYDGVRLAADGKKVIITIEDNSGALSEKVCSALAGISKFRSFAFKFPDEFTHVSGKQQYLLGLYGMTTEGVCKKIKELLAKG
jgi:transketolase